MDACEHEWRTGPIADPIRLKRQAVCVRCYHLGELAPDVAAQWPEWTEADYWEHQEHVDPAAYAQRERV